MSEDPLHHCFTPIFMNARIKRIAIPAILLLAIAIILTMIGMPGNPDSTARAEVSPSLAKPRSADRPAADPDRERRRRESISLAAQKWYEELLEKFPEMKPAFRDVPDHRNGFLHLLLLAESLKEPKLTPELDDMLRGGTPWDSRKFKQWLAENRDYRDQIAQIAELPDHSIKGLDLNRISNVGRQASEFGNILSASACLAFEEGDRETALRYARDVISLGNHLTDVEIPSMLAAVIAAGYQSHLRDVFVERIMPALSSDPESLASWHDALFQKEEYASEYSRFISGEWNVTMRTNILPALLGENVPPPGEKSFQIPDADAFFEQYTAANHKLAASFSNSGPGRFDLSQGELDFSGSGLDPKTLGMLHEKAFNYPGLFQAFGVQVTREAMISAVIAIQTGEEPPVDPVSGKPFQWDAQSRTISTPEGVKGPDSIELR
jgi:hypothetical protein